MTTRRVLLVTPSLDDNSLGRTYCLWMLGRHIGWDVTVVSSEGDRIWSPLDGTLFSQSCRRLSADPHKDPAWQSADLVIAVKPLPSSFGLALAATDATRTPLIVDIDDPDLEVRTVWLGPHYRLLRWITQPLRQVRLRRLKRAARRTPSSVSNPILARIYGGIVVPHVREPVLSHPPSDIGTAETTVVFVGSPKPHKGIDELRKAVAALHERGFRLTVTASPPPDAAPWESWVGSVPLAEGQRMVAEADVVAIPSQLTSWSRAQLPAKLIDAMMAGRAIVASDVGPIRWALNGAGRLVPPGDADALRDALASFESDSAREEAGAKARLHAGKHYTVAALAPLFERFGEDVMRNGGSGKL